MGVLHLRLLWLVPLFQSVGGGPEIASSMMYAVLTDIFPMEQRWAMLRIHSHSRKLLAEPTLIGPGHRISAD